MDAARAYERAVGTLEEVESVLPRLSGAQGVRLKLDASGAAVGPPNGAKRFRGRLQTRPGLGGAEVTLIPFSTWGTEVHVAVSPPATLIGRIVWSARRRHRIAEGLAAAIASAAVQTNRPEDVKAQTPPRNTAA